MIYGTGGLNWVVDGVEARLNHGGGIHLTDGAVIRNSYFHHNGQQGMTADALLVASPGILMEDTEISFNNTARFNLDWEGGGNKFVGSNITIRNNYSHDNYGPGIWIDVFSENVLIEGNVVEDNFRAGIFFEVSNGAVIRNNYAEGNGLDDPRAQAWGWASGILISASRNAEVYGNTVVNNGNGITAAQQDREGEGAPWAESIVLNLDVHDNFITSAPDTIPPTTNGWTGAVEDVNDDAIFLSRNNDFQNNTYFGDPSADLFAWIGGSVTFAEWQAYGLDVTGSITPIIGHSAYLVGLPHLYRGKRLPRSP